MSGTQSTSVNDDSKATAISFWLAITLFMVGFILSFCFDGTWTGIAGAVCIGFGQLSVLYNAYRRGEIRTNWGMVKRSGNSTWFNAELWLWSLVGIAITGLLVLRATGWIAISKSQ